MVLLHALASIPSPSNGVLRIGPLPFHMYGLMLALGVLAATWLAERRWVARGHDGKDIGDMVVWVVVAGVLGARLYHVVTDYELFTDDWLRAFKIWEGGLGIWGAVIGGAIAVAVIARRRHLDLGDLVDAIAPGVALAQAIGRWGNWFNQELFGRPTTLPWGLEISPHHRPPGYGRFETFQPVFLYESLWCLAIVGVLLWAERRFRLMKGQICALYVMLYTFGRFFFENMRIDTAHLIGPLRLNAWVSIAVFVGATAWFLWLRRHGTPAVPHVARVDEPVEPVDER